MQSLLFRFSTHTSIARQTLVVAAACLPLVTWAQMSYVSQVRSVSANTHYFYSGTERTGSVDIYGNYQFKTVRRGDADSEVITSDPADFGSFSRTANAYVEPNEYHSQKYVGVSATLQSTLLNDGVHTDFSISMQRGLYPVAYSGGYPTFNNDLNDWGRVFVQTTFDLTSASSFEVLLSGPSRRSPLYISTFQLVNEQTGAVTKFDYGTPVQLNLSEGRYSLTSDLRVGNGFAAGSDYTYSGSFNMTSVPEPSTWCMMLLGIMGISQFALRKRNS